MRSVHWSITGKCNFQCRHCLVSASSAYHPELPLSDCLHIVEEAVRAVADAAIAKYQPDVK